jgi:hypothetical protein
MATSDSESEANGANSDRGRLAAVGAGAADAYRLARERTAAAGSSARDAGRRTIEGLESNPVAAVIGGLALGAVAAALLPKTRREDALLGDVGRRLTDSAREAARAATDAGRAQIDELGLTREGVRRKLDEFTDRAVGKVKASGKSRKK